MTDRPPPLRPSAEWVALGGAREDLDALQDEVARIAADVLGEELPLPADRCAAIAAVVVQERAARKDPALNRTDLIREALAEYLERRTAKPKRAK